jgi:hypothetical protein
MGKPIGAALGVILAVTTLVTACGGGDAGDDGGAAADKASSSPPQVGTFRVCQPGRGGGGYRIRAIGITCDEVRRILPRLLSSATLITRRERERVYRNDDGWTCLSQGQRRRFGFTLILCVRGSQAILYRFS